MSKRILSLVLAFVMVLGTFGTVFAATGNAKVDWLVEQGLVKGDQNGNLNLEANIDRASVAKLVVEALNQTSTAAGMQAYQGPFSDVPVTNWSNGNINVVYGLNLMVGNNGQFMPSATISNAEVLTILVRMMDGEPANAVWPATHIAKAQELGILEGTEISNFMAPAVREDIFEMFYNVLVNKQVGKYEIVKGIVLENYRVENLDKNEVMVEVIREVQKAEFATESRLEKGDQETFEIPAKWDVESLLGKVVDLTIDEKGNVVNVTVDGSYDYITLKNVVFTANKFGKYTVKLDERYKTDDERIFRTYFNNDSVSYKDLETGEVNSKSEEFVAYANVTLKNSKVLFIDGFGSFADIAPVATDVDAKGNVAFYNDEVGYEGEVDKINVKNADIINVVDGKFLVGDYSEIKTNDVIHVIEDAKGNASIVFVRPEADAKVEGEFKDARTPRRNEEADVYMSIDGTYYPAYYSTVASNVVYSFYSSEKEFDVLTEKEYLDELKGFEKEEVIALLDIFGDVQLLATETEILANEYALISDVYGTEFRLLLTNNTKEWFETDRDTKLTGLDSRENRLSQYRVNKLVKAYADEENLLSELKLYDVDNAKDIEDATLKTHKDVVFGDVTKVAKNAVEFKGNDELFKFVNSKTVVFVQGINKVVTESVMTVADFVKKYEQAEDGLTGYAVTNSRDGELVEAIVITTGATLKAAEKGESILGKVSYVGRNFIDLDNDVRYSVTSDLLATLAKGDIVEITLEKGSDTKVKAIRDPFELTDKEKETLKVDYITVKSTAKGRIEDENGKLYYIDGAKIFDNYKIGTELTIVVDKYNYVTLIKVGAAPETPAPGTPKVEDATVGGKAAVVKNNAVEVEYTEETAVIPALVVNFKEAVKVQSITDKTGKSYNTEAQLEEAKAFLGYTGDLSVLADKIELTGTTKTFADVIAKLGDSFKVTVVNEAGEALTLTINLKLDAPASSATVKELKGTVVDTPLATVKAITLPEAEVIGAFKISIDTDLLLTIGAKTWTLKYNATQKVWASGSIQNIAPTEIEAGVVTVDAK